MGKIIRIIFLTITLTLLIIALVFNITSKSISKEILSEVWNNIIPQSTVEKAKDNKITKWFKDIKNNEEVQNFLDKYLNSDEVNQIKEDLKDTKEKVQKELLETVNEYLKEQEEKLSSSQRFALKTYRFITNAKLKGLLILAILINIILIGLAERSLFRWIKSASYALALSGVAILLLVKWIKTTIHSIIKITITLKVLTQPAYILLISGIVIRIIYLIIHKIIKVNKEDKDEVS